MTTLGPDAGVLSPAWAARPRQPARCAPERGALTSMSGQADTVWVMVYVPSKGALQQWRPFLYGSRSRQLANAGSSAHCSASLPRETGSRSNSGEIKAVSGGDGDGRDGDRHQVLLSTFAGQPEDKGTGRCEKIGDCLAPGRGAGRRPSPMKSGSCGRCCLPRPGPEKLLSKFV